MSIEFGQLLSNIPGVVYRCECDADWTMHYISAGIEALTGYQPDEIMGNSERSFASLIYATDAEQVERDVMAAIESNSIWDVEYRLLHRDGTYRWVSEQGVGIFVDDQLQYLDGFVADISERKNMEDALRQSQQRVRELAYYDAVTRLPNRNLVFEQIESRITRALDFHLLFIDLDGFKPVNDQYGHATGDLVLAKIGQKVRQSVGESDIVGRIGGDEFVVVCECESIAQKISASVREPIEINGNTIKVTASIGVCQFPAHGVLLSELLAAADSAMYRAKSAGKNRLEYLHAA